MKNSKIKRFKDSRIKKVKGSCNSHHSEHSPTFIISFGECPE
ncbi:hypothetical protein HMPREF6485_2827 [Segatella buccae ATCC 33574]|uniref:Uncharacterized protein n=1 Tax=Segatella buccae ATCC 33574 TaxID=873513 RepID=E6KB40_9BACT|nr:hypothetical protein HMPREF6485_2827 [Segatella buccae ATCC 33574]